MCSGRLRLDERLPHLVVRDVDVLVAVRIAADQCADDASAAGDPLDFGHGLVDAAVGQQHDRAEPARVVRAVVDEPVVVGLHHRQMQLGVLVGDDDLRDARGRVEDRRVDEVGVHLLEPHGRVVAAA